MKYNSNITIGGRTDLHKDYPWGKEKNIGVGSNAGKAILHKGETIIKGKLYRQTTLEEFK